MAVQVDRAQHKTDQYIRKINGNEFFPVKIEAVSCTVEGVFQIEPSAQHVKNAVAEKKYGSISCSDRKRKRLFGNMDHDDENAHEHSHQIKVYKSCLHPSSFQIFPAAELWPDHVFTQAQGP